jgi:hypothetical protein
MSKWMSGRFVVSLGLASFLNTDAFDIVSRVRMGTMNM